MITAPSGAGKTSLVQELVRLHDNLRVSVSHTTRPARTGEEDGVNYHFVTKKRFEHMLSQGDFLEAAEVYGHHYGTSQSWVENQLQLGNDVILEIDWQGAEQVRNLLPDVCSVFILPPSLEALTERLKVRAQDDYDVIENRMRQAQSVIKHVMKADFVVVNDDFKIAIHDISAIIRSQSLNANSQKASLTDLISSLT